MLLVDKDGVNGFFGLFMQSGKVALQFMLNGASELLTSTKDTYNDGEWYQVRNMF